jgi:hypothetical protein
MRNTPGLGMDEYGVEAELLNQTHIGLAFGGKDMEGNIVYGRIAGFKILRTHVDIFISDTTVAVQVSLSGEVFFTRYRNESA